MVANCIDSLDILTIATKNSQPVQTKSSQSIFGVLDYLDYVKENKEGQKIHTYDNVFDSLENCSIAYVAGTIERKIENCESSGRFSCKKCTLVFSIATKKLTFHSIQQKKNIPCKSSYEICAIADKHLKETMYELNFDYNNLLNSILHVDMYSNTNFEDHIHHKFFIVEFIVQEFIRIQANYSAKKATLNEQAKMMRSKLKKMVHNLGQ